MKLQVTQENLSKSLNIVARIANSRSTLPILSNIMIKTIGTRLSIAATNLEIAINCYVGSKVSKEGSITVPGRLMQDFVSSLPSGVIDLSLKDYKLYISTDKYQSIINGVAADEFPVMPAITKGNKWTIDAKALKLGLQQVVIAASSDEARPILTAVYLHNLADKLYLVATDSYRLAEKEIGTSNHSVSLLIPASAMQELLRILADYDDLVEVLHDDQQVSFKAGEVELVTRLIEGNYPDYRKLIPSKFATSATLKKTDFTSITKVSSLFARESAGSVTISVKGDEGLVSISSVASQIGENTASANAKASGEGSITLNSKYILDALGALAGDEVKIAFNEKLEPCVLKPSTGKDYIHVIMPLKS